MQVSCAENHLSKTSNVNWRIENEFMKDANNH